MLYWLAAVHLQGGQPHAFGFLLAKLPLWLTRCVRPGARGAQSDTSALLDVLAGLKFKASLQCANLAVLRSCTRSSAGSQPSA